MIDIRKYEEIKKKYKQNQSLYTRVFSSDIPRIKQLHHSRINDKWNNLFHLSSYSGLINDPNGLVKANGKYHIFYQWAPFTPIHSMKHWGHFETTNFIDYIHTGLAIEPELKEEKDGIFSGGAINHDGKVYVFWTGNIKPYGSLDEERSSFTLVGEWSEEEKKVVNKKPLFEVDKTKYTGHFRDPKPLKINDKFYLLHGAQKINKTGALSVYESESVDKDYKLRGDLKIEPEINESGYMWECPDYFVIDDKEFLVFSPQGKSFYGEGNENRDTVVFVFGKLDIETLIFHRKGEPQIADEGFDFYAPQTFSDANRMMLIGWAGIGEADAYATFDNGWAHSLTLSRELTVNSDNKIVQSPLEEYKKIRGSEITSSKTVDLSKSRLSEIYFEFDENLEFKLENNKSENIMFKFNKNELFVSRENMSFDQAPNYGKTRIRRHYNKFKNVRIFIDNSLIEIYANEGEFVFTSKYYLDGDIKLISTKSKKMSGYNLKPFGIEWNV